MPRRIAVTGTRGKSGVTRLVAAGLRASGARVLAKTTGSRPVLILPDGTERDILRSGPASVREQVRLAALAAAVGADTLVAEMMSVGGECLAAEARAILRPGMLAVTNVRLDHLEAMGRDRSAIARTLAEAVPARAAVFVPEEEADPAFVAPARRRGATLHPVAPGLAAADGPPSPGDFEPNRRLARAVLAACGVDRRTAEAGFAAAAPDPGHMSVRRGDFGRPPRPADCVNLFAANEPDSSAASLRQVEAVLPLAGQPLVGVLSLRLDRGDRTRQWIGAARDGFFRGFAVLALIGPGAPAALGPFRRAVRPPGPAVARVAGRSPEAVMDAVMALAPGPAPPVVVGLGNFVGPGEGLVRFWERQRSAHAG